MEHHKNKTIAERIAKGDSQAENELFSHYRKRIEFLVGIRLRGRAPIEDQKDLISEIQSAVLISLRKGGFDPSRGKPLNAYIAGTASNIIGQYFRKIRKEKEVVSDGLDEVNLDSENTLSELMTKERNERLRKCLGRLKSKYREVLILRIYEKKSIADIAGEIKVEPRRVSERIHYALSLFLKECRKENYFQYYDDSDK